jgi:lysine 2,3-aminomutase
MIEQASPHIASLARRSEAIKKQFYSDGSEESDPGGTNDPGGQCLLSDPLLEEEHTVVRGLVHKYPNRALVLLTLRCAAYCRFCTRQRKVGDLSQFDTTPQEIDAIAEYLSHHPKVRELILSGGDPLIVPDTLEYAVRKLTRIPSVKLLRIGTRLPVTDPRRVTEKKLEYLREVMQPVYVGIHFEHPDEITGETVRACKILRSLGCILFSQSVFLRGINDDYKTLYTLFSRLIEIGVKPYYIFRCDMVKGAERFISDFQKEIEIMTQLKISLSGMACPTYVVDTPNGSGKIPVPLKFWDASVESFRDFNGKTFQMDQWEGQHATSALCGLHISER